MNGISDGWVLAIFIGVFVFGVSGVFGVMYITEKITRRNRRK